jgi:hypothetical protein
MKVFEPAYVIESDGSKTISCYRVTISNALQFDYVASLLAAGLSFRQISRVVRENSRSPWLRVEEWVRFRRRPHLFLELYAQLVFRFNRI